MLFYKFKKIIKMKKIFLFILALSFITTSMFAQKKIKEKGFVKYTITDVKGEGTEMMKGSTVSIFITEDKTHTDMNMMDGMMVIKTYVDTKNEKTTMLIDVMGKKTSVDVTKEEMEEIKEKNKDEDSKTVYTYDKKITKKILGYKCYQVKVKSTKGSEMIMFITEKIDLNPAAAEGMEGQSIIDYNSLKGFPLEYTIVVKQGTTMTYTAKEVSGKVDESVFDIDDEGYKKMTMEEFSKMK